MVPRLGAHVLTPCQRALAGVSTRAVDGRGFPEEPEKCMTPGCMSFGDNRLYGQSKNARYLHTAVGVQQFPPGVSNNSLRIHCAVNPIAKPLLIARTA